MSATEATRITALKHIKRYDATTGVFVVASGDTGEVFRYNRTSGSQVGVGAFLKGLVFVPASATPEPGSLAFLLGIGVSCAGFVLRRRNRKK